MLDAQAAAGQPGADVGLRGRRDAEALRVLGGGDEVVVLGARAIEEPAQERVLRVGMGMREDEPQAHRLGGRRRADPLRRGEAARDVGDEDAVGRAGARHGGEDREQHEDGDDLSHPRLNAVRVGNLLGLRAR